MRIALYLLGVLLIIGGLAWSAIHLGIPPLWVGFGALILIGFGLIGAATNSRHPVEISTRERRSI